MEANQTVNYILPSQTFSASQTNVQPLNILPKQYLNNRLAHLIAIVASGTVTPTFTTAPTIVGTNNFVNRFDFFDGSIYRFQGGFNHLRMRERLHSGGVRIADPDTNTASTSSRYVNRILHMGPPQLAAAPSDFAVPTGMFANGTLTITWGALTDLSADTAAATGSIRLIAKLGLFDELRIPPACQFQNLALNASDNNISGRALYLAMALLNSSSFDAISAGDFGNVTLDFGFGQLVPAINAKDLTNSYLDDFNRGDLSTILGEPAGSTDINGKVVNHASPTAITSVPADLQPILWMPPAGRLSKAFSAETLARLKWDGSQTSGVLLYERILAQEGPTVGALASKALAGTGLSVKALAIKTTSKKEYRGPYGAYMPWKAKVGA